VNPQDDDLGTPLDPDPSSPDPDGGTPDPIDQPDVPPQAGAGEDEWDAWEKSLADREAKIAEREAKQAKAEKEAQADYTRKTQELARLADERGVGDDYREAKKNLRKEQPAPEKKEWTPVKFYEGEDAATTRRNLELNAIAGVVAQAIEDRVGSRFSKVDEFLSEAQQKENFTKRATAWARVERDVAKEVGALSDEQMGAVADRILKVNGLFESIETMDPADAKDLYKTFLGKAPGGAVSKPRPSGSAPRPPKRTGKPDAIGARGRSGGNSSGANNPRTDREIRLSILRPPKK
jgi:hypothetical protein